MYLATNLYYKAMQRLAVGGELHTRSPVPGMDRRPKEVVCSCGTSTGSDEY
jgi:hypothetical protein